MVEARATLSTLQEIPPLIARPQESSHVASPMPIQAAQLQRPSKHGDEYYKSFRPGAISSLEAGLFLSRFTYTTKGVQTCLEDVLSLTIRKGGNVYVIDPTNGQSRQNEVLVWAHDNHPDAPLPRFTGAMMDEKRQLPTNAKATLLKSDEFNPDFIHNACDLYWTKDPKSNENNVTNDKLDDLLSKYLDSAEALARSFRPRLVNIVGKISPGLFEVEELEPPDQDHFLLRTNSVDFSSEGKVRVCCEYVDTMSIKLPNGFTTEARVCEERSGTMHDYMSASSTFYDAARALENTIRDLDEEALIHVIDKVNDYISSGPKFGTFNGDADTDHPPRLIKCAVLNDFCIIRWIILKK